MKNLPKMLDIVNRSLDALAPQVKENAVIAIAAAHAQGFPIKVFETYRSPERQNMLYAKGPRVTTKKAWESFHQYGLAFDIAFWFENDWSWKGDFKGVAKFFMQQGFEWLHPYEDAHFQMRGTLITSQAHRLFNEGGFPAVWNTLWPVEKPV